MFKVDYEGSRVGREQRAKKHGKPRGDRDNPALSEQVGGKGEDWQDLEMR